MNINIYVREESETTTNNTRLGRIESLGVSNRIDKAKVRAQTGTQGVNNINNRQGLLGSSTNFKQVAFTGLKVAPAIGLRAFKQASESPFVSVTDSILEQVVPGLVGVGVGVGAGTLTTFALSAIAVPEPISSIAGFLTLITATIISTDLTESLFERRRLRKEIEYTQRNKVFTNQLRGVSIRGSF